MGNEIGCACVYSPMEFSIEPRLAAPPSTQGEIVVKPPPDLPRETSGNPLSRLLPVAMIVATAGMMVLYLTSGSSAMRNPMFMFFPVMMIVSLLGTVATGGRSVSRFSEINRDRRDYLRYLGSVDLQIAEAIEQQRLSLSWSNPEPAVLWSVIGSRRMWERRPDDADFGHVRIGLASQGLATSLVAPDLGPPEKSDPVTSMELQRLVRHRSTVPSLPVPIALTELTAITIDGDHTVCRSLLRAVICHLASMHSPQHLRIAAVLDPIAAAEWDWLKWLPHHRHPYAVDDGGPARLTYNSLSAAEMALSRCDGEHVVLVVDGAMTSPMRAVARGLDGVTVLEVGTTLESLADLRLVLSEECLDASSDDGDVVSARPDAMTIGQAVAFARRLSCYRPVATTPAAVHISPSIAWPELMGTGDIGGLDASAFRRARALSGRDGMLSVPIGVSEHGDPVELDIKEAAAGGLGPHGLCIGATGSGKSEFLRTLTLGMITAHPSEMLNVVLVDFKGGATFLGFERAPHVAAVITNLADEAHLVARMRDALAGEINRRQELLRAAGNYANIADYNAAATAGAGSAPLPALFIVVDEFSELLSQHPDFIDLFIAIGRLGRSLGVHLLLASQRVDEGRLRGLESHLSYRVCLKTFSAAESRSVLGVPDAYHLPGAPGAAYLKTGAADPLRFQTAFVSGPYVEAPNS